MKTSLKKRAKVCVAWVGMKICAAGSEVFSGLAGSAIQTAIAFDERKKTLKEWKDND